MTPRLAMLLLAALLAWAWVLMPRPMPREHRIPAEVASHVG